jgi:ATP/maltotriose-dependent transcriptional regulator MalT
MSDLAGARMAFDQASGWVGRISNEYFNSWAAFELSRGLFEAALSTGDPAFAHQAQMGIEKIQNSYFRVLGKCETAKYSLSTGGKKESRVLIAELERTARTLDKDHSRASALCECAEVREKLGDPKGCEKDLQEAQEIAQGIDNSYFRSWALSGLVRCGARIARDTGDTRLLEKYEGIMGMLEDRYLEAWAHAEVARTMCRLKDTKSCKKALEMALAAAKQVRDPVNAAMGMTEVALAALQHGNRALADDVRERTGQRAQEVREHQRSLVLSEVARMMASLGDELGAKRHIQDAIDLAQPVSYEYFRSWALSGVVRALAHLGCVMVKKP